MNAIVFQSQKSLENLPFLAVLQPEMNLGQVREMLLMASLTYDFALNLRVKA